MPFLRIQQTRRGRTAGFGRMIAALLVAYSPLLLADDTTPDPFSFTAVTGVAPGSVQVSNAISVTGIDQPAPISIVGGSYSVNNGPYLTAAGAVASGSSVIVRQTASAGFSTTTSATLNIGGVSGPFRVATRPADTQPEPFSFASVSNAAPGLTYSSNEIIVSGLDIPVAISVTGGSYGVNGQALTSAAGNVFNGDHVIAAVVASSGFSTTVSSSVKIGSASSAFRVTTRVADTTPNPFSFAPVASASPGSVQTSKSITVSGIEAPASISVTGGSYSLNGGPATAAAGTVGNGSTVTVRQTASSNFSTSNTTTLRIGGVNGGFTVTTVARDTTPDAFTFSPTNGAVIGSARTSNGVAVTGINSAASISVSPGSRYNVNGGPFTGVPGTVNKGDIVAVQLTAASTPATTVTATLTLGGIAVTYSVTTAAETVDHTPLPFSFPSVSNVALNAKPVSNPVTVRGIAASAPISIIGGAYSVNGGKFVSSAGTVNPNDTVRVAVQAGGSASITSSAVLTIGGIKAQFTVTTAADSTPGDFSLNPPVYNAQPGSAVNSNEIDADSFNVDQLPVSIVGGLYSINGGPFVSDPGFVVSGDELVVQAIAPIDYGFSKTATLTIGTVSNPFVVTTVPANSSINGPFSIAPVINAPLALWRGSGSFFVGGIGQSAAISIVGGLYRIGRGAFTADPGIVHSGDRVQARALSSANYGTTTAATLKIGSASAAFSVTTLSGPVNPTPFSFPSVINMPPGSMPTSRSMTVAGITTPAALSISGATYSLNGGDFVSDNAVVVAGDKLELRLTAAAQPAAHSTASLSIGEITKTFSATTRPDLATLTQAPSSVLDLSHFKLTLPIDSTGGFQGSPLEIESSALVGGYFSSYFYKSADGGLSFWSPGVGAKTGSTDYTRSELREELEPPSIASNWGLRGPSYLDATLSVNLLPTAANKVVIGQIHGIGNAAPLIKLQYSRVGGSGRIDALIDPLPFAPESPTNPDYVLATNLPTNQPFSYNISVSDGVLWFSVNGGMPSALLIDPAWKDIGMYFKAGVYPQSKAQVVTDGAQATFYAISVKH